MNRPIKFRAFYKEYGSPEKPFGSMFYDILPTTSDFSEWLISFDSDKQYDGDFKVGEEIEIMQITGLLDKNGKEIYEGDIVNLDRYLGTPGKFENVQGVVTYRETAFQVEFEKDWAWCELHRACEIIGNVFENPELIKSV